MATLSDYCSVVDRFARSANLERDFNRSEPFDGYVVTSRALDVIERVARTAASGPSGGAWTLTGPYGSGKSSLGLLLDAALGPASPRRTIAWKLIAQASPRVGSFIQKAHQRHETLDVGFHRALVTARSEPLGHTLLRALHLAAIRSYGKNPSAKSFRAAKTMRDALRNASAENRRRASPPPGSVLEIARCLAAARPLLIVIDEFGKSLEAIRDDLETDPYLLQQIAEAGQGSGLPIFMLTLQHLPFGEYQVSASGSHRGEWAKVQGRFENVPYVESASQTRNLIGTVFQISNDELQDRINCWAQFQAKQMQSLGFIDLSDPEVVGSCYPLHPMAAMVLPELCNRYGQHERTLFSFLTSHDLASAKSFLANTMLPRCGPVPSLGIDSVYDYFVASGTSAILSPSQSGRWTEIATRLRDTHGLSNQQTRLAKSIALLNLVSTSGTLRASRQVLAAIDTNVGESLAALEKAGIVTYRDFADEYRVWHGTDVDIRRLLDIARQRLQKQALVKIILRLDPPSPMVAARHSAEHDVLRVFARRYVDGDKPIEPLIASSPYDGEVLLVVGSDRKVPSLVESQLAYRSKPIVAAIPEDIATFDKAAREVAAITSVLEDPSVDADWVARRELGERLAQARIALEHSTSVTFGDNACRWLLLNASGAEELRAGRGSAVLSTAADRAYPFTPRVGNEMLNRTDATSQGAKARRLLLEAMIEHGSTLNLGLKGYGPEMAMYLAFLKETGIHGFDARNGNLVFRKPHDTSLQPAWEVLASEFRQAKTRRVSLREIFDGLLSPPVGMKAAVIPVFVTAALLAFKEEIAIYEHGTFKPLLTADLSERMVRNPGHFETKHFANTVGARREVVDALAKHLGIRPGFRKHRVSNVLAVVGHLVSSVRKLDGYTRQTRNLSSATLKGRDVLRAAVEPDELLFRCLPTALGFGLVPTDTSSYTGAHPYAEAVVSVLRELTECQDRLLDELFRLILDASAEPSRQSIAVQAAALEKEVLDPEVRAFVLALSNDGVDTDRDWARVIATVLTRKATSEWTDSDPLQYHQELSQRVASFQRLVALHTERQANGTGQLNTLRVAITRPDGNEHVRLVGIDQKQRHHVNRALEAILEQLTEITGSSSRSQKALLALLGERILGDQDASGEKHPRKFT